MNEEIKVVEQPKMNTLSIRTRTKVEDLPKIIGKTYMEIMEYMNTVGAQPIEAPFTAYYNLDMNDLDVEMGFPVQKAFEGKGEIAAKELPSCKAVTYMFKGAYSAMSSVYEEIFKFMEEKGLKATGVYYEYYYNSPMEVPESELLTKIVMPLV